jgi:signal transduction histidine kinase
MKLRELLISASAARHAEILCTKDNWSRFFLNIIINSIQAIKLKKAGSGSIVIKTYMENEYVCCSVKDNGIGISEENLERIFNPFFTTHEVGRNRFGLSISHDIIVNKHGGFIDIKSQLGNGTEFIIKLRS